MHQRRNVLAELEGEGEGAGAGEGFAGGTAMCEEVQPAEFSAVLLAFGGEGGVEFVGGGFEHKVGGNVCKLDYYIRGNI